MSENDFYTLNGNSYRGSRYSTFQGGGIDTQGNVSSAANQNAENNTANTPSAQTPQIASEVLNVSDRGVGQLAAPSSGIKTPDGGVLGAAGGIGGAGLDVAGRTIGGQVGANIASGASALNNVGSALSNRVSSGLSGLLGTSGGTTAAGGAGAAAASSEKLLSAPATGGNGFGTGASIGSGVATAATVLLTGGNLKDAALQGAGAAGGAYAGAALGAPLGPIGSAVGSFVGSTIGSFLGKTFGGVFGGETPRSTLSAALSADDTGRFTVTGSGGRKAGKSGDANANKFGTQVADILNKFADTAGLKYTGDFWTDTNIGKKDVKSRYNNNGAKTVISKKAGDVGGVALTALRDRGNYTLSGDADFSSFWDKSLAGAKDINQLAADVDGYYASRNLMRSPALVEQEKSVRRTGDRYATFFG